MPSIGGAIVDSDALNYGGGWGWGLARSPRLSQGQGVVKRKMLRSHAYVRSIIENTVTHVHACGGIHSFIYTGQFTHIDRAHTVFLVQAGRQAWVEQPVALVRHAVQETIRVQLLRQSSNAPPCQPPFLLHLQKIHFQETVSRMLLALDFKAGFPTTNCSHVQGGIGASRP